MFNCTHAPEFVVVTNECEKVCSECGLVVDTDFNLRRHLPHNMTNASMNASSHSGSRHAEEFRDFLHANGIHEGVSEEASRIYDQLSTSKARDQVRKHASLVAALMSNGVPDELYSDKFNHISTNFKKRAEKFINEHAHAFPIDNPTAFRTRCEFYFTLLRVASFREIARLSKIAEKIRENLNARSKTIVIYVYKIFFQSANKLTCKDSCIALGDSNISSVTRLAAQIRKIGLHPDDFK